MRKQRGRRVVLAVVAIVAGCGTSSEPAGGGSATVTAAAGSASGGSGGAVTPTPNAKAAPAMTPALFVTEPTAFTIEGVERGIWISENGGAFQQKCRVELGMTMGRFGKLRGEAMKAPDAVTCDPKGSYAVCSFARPGGDPADAGSRASWVFATDDDSEQTVLIAVLFGTYDWATVEPQLPAKTACPRPSADPP